MNCPEEQPEVLEVDTPLTWVGSDNDAMLVYKIGACENGSSTFELSSWKNGTGGEWKKWIIYEGVMIETNENPPNCSLGVKKNNSKNDITISPNPVKETLYINTDYELYSV